MNNWHGKDTKKDWNSQENLKENGWGHWNLKDYANQSRYSKVVIS